MRCSSVAVIIAIIATPAIASATGGRGAMCLASSDCGEWLRCVSNTCVDVATLDESRDPDASLKEGTHFFLGAAVGASTPTIWGSAGESFHLGLRGGVLIDGHAQFELELEPGVVININSSVMSMFGAVVTAGYLIPISSMVSWVLRIGGGTGGIFAYAPNTVGSGVAFGEFRADVCGVTIRTSKHVLVEFNVPSFRVLFTAALGDSLTGTPMYMFVSNVTFNYIF